MADQEVRKRFSLAAQRNPVRDQDNAQPRMKPPAQATIPPPSLAPPGMASVGRKELPGKKVFVPFRHEREERER